MANSEVERFNRSILKSIRATHSEGNFGNRNYIRFYETTLTHRMPRHKRLQQNFCLTDDIKLDFHNYQQKVLAIMTSELDTEAKQQMKTYADRRNHWR